MESEVIHYFFTQGPWAILFVGGLVYTMKWTREREDKMQTNMEQLLDKYDQMYKDISKIYTEMMKNQQNILITQSLIEMMREECTKQRNMDTEILNKVQEITVIIDQLKKQNHP